MTLRKAASLGLAIALLPLALPAAAQTPIAAVSGTPTVQAEPEPAENRELARALQRELKRLGCYDGEANGIWTQKSRAAYRSFVRQAKLSVDGEGPDVAVLDAASAARVRVCVAAAAAEDSEDKQPAKPKAEPPRQEPAKVEPPRPREAQVEKEPRRPVKKEVTRTARQERPDAREQRVRRERPVQREARAIREPRQGASPHAGKRLCFGAGRNELVTCQ